MAQRTMKGCPIKRALVIGPRSSTDSGMSAVAGVGSLVQRSVGR